jgi:hypothetical protein
MIAKEFLLKKPSDHLGSVFKINRICNFVAHDVVNINIICNFVAHDLC